MRFDVLRANVPPPTTFAIFVAGYFAAIRLGEHTGTGVFAGQSPDQAVVLIQLFMLVFAAALLSLAIVIAEREWLRIREADLSSKLIDAQDSERGRIASELHDNVGQQLALLLLGMEQLKRDAPMSESGQRQSSPFARIESSRRPCTTSSSIAA